MANEGSPSLKLNNVDWQKIGKGALIAGVGAAAIYAIKALLGLDWGDWTPAAVALGGILTNLVRKFLADNEQGGNE